MEPGQALLLRDRVLIGLALKMYGSFECLMEEAKRGRSEAMHHFIRGLRVKLKR